MAVHLALHPGLIGITRESKALVPNGLPPRSKIGQEGELPLIHEHEDHDVPTPRAKGHVVRPVVMAIAGTSICTSVEDARSCRRPSVTVRGGVVALRVLVPTLGCSALLGAHSPVSTTRVEAQDRVVAAYGVWRSSCSISMGSDRTEYARHAAFNAELGSHARRQFGGWPGCCGR